MRIEIEQKCDGCQKETEPVYFFAGQELCISCLKKALYRRTGNCDCCRNRDDRTYFYGGRFICATCLEQTVPMKGLDYIR